MGGHASRDQAVMIVFLTMLYLAVVVDPPTVPVDDACPAISQVELGIWKEVPNATFVTLEGAKLKKFLRNMGRTDIDADTLLVVSAAGQPNVILIFYNKSCIAQMTAVPESLFEKIFLGDSI